MRVERFELARREFIFNEMKNTDISHFSCENKKLATWDDLYWQFIDKFGHKYRYFFVDSLGQITINNYTSVHSFPINKRRLLMAYCLHVHSLNIVRSNKVGRVTLARKWLSFVEDIDDTSFEKITNFGKDRTHSTFNNLVQFFIWLKNYGLINSQLNWAPPEFKSKTGPEQAEAIKEKMPEEKVLLALGAIHYDVVPLDDSLWDLSSLSLRRDLMVCVMSVLGLASPNRIVAEQTIMECQSVKKVEQKYKGSLETVHYLNWKGSKGYKDFNNHILSQLAPSVERSLRYLKKVTEPGRILARFYCDPSLSLENLLLKSPQFVKKAESLKLNMKKPVNILTIGLVLGFYEDSEHCIIVEKGTPDSIYVKAKSFRLKEIKKLEPNDKLLLYIKYIHRILGVSMSTVNIESIFGKKVITVFEFQNRLISYIKSTHPSFPKLSNGSKNGTCDMRTALFSFLGHQLIKSNSGAGMVARASFYMPVSPSTIGVIYSNRLKNLQGKEPSIFIQHGFSAEFSLTPHQPRHFLNDSGEKQRLPRSILNMWSGRKDPRQIVSYVHKTGIERGSEISDVLFTDEENEHEIKKNIKVITIDAYNALYASVATETSVGICTQNKSVSPCTFFNDFETHCSLCSSSCHIAHDYESISLLEKDIKWQQLRLNEVKNSPKFSVSHAMNSWFKIHHRNTQILSNLVGILSDQKIRKGTVVRYLGNKNEFRITDLENETVEIHKLVVEDSSVALHKEIEIKSEDIDDYQDLLGMI
ncbi:hypothetical protein [Marinomonas sp. PE14-40]|uniref:hypothetical protein n=1 Tax=Marinomonas sp. PE14-40 TaxID=3060621 RepID=UPI003F6813B0